MPTDMSFYKYFKIGNNFYYAKLNPVFLLWLRYCTKTPILLNDFTFKSFLKFIIRQIDKKQIDSGISFPFYGQVCIPVNRGYKIFNFHKGSVRKIFNNKIDLKIVETEIDIVVKVSQFLYAPDILGWNIKERWYEECDVGGVDASMVVKSDHNHLLKIFNEYINTFINHIVFSDELIRVDSQKYLIDIVSFLKTYVEKLPEPREQISTFITAIAEKISSVGNSNIVKAFTYGDLKLENARITKKGLKIIDWETSCNRSLTFDFYNYFFSFFRHNSVSIYAPEVINIAFSSLGFKMATKSQEISNHIVLNADLYRWYYYLERLCLIFKNRGHVIAKKWKINIDRNVSLFRLFEKQIDNKRNIRRLHN